jgi:hypothetical protein
MADNSDLIRLLLPPLMEIMVYPMSPGPYPSPTDSETIERICTAVKIPEGEMWAAIRTYCHPASGGLN